ncbi:MAG TPA: DNA repair protein RecO [Longimicrobiaceae bacterium]|nr:DNA repair protein RecO [Longimicrobiaceae bacterium]
MPLVTTRALVLQTFPYSETSKILRLFTWDLGVRSVIAKGALRPRSRFGGILEPFTEGSASLYVKEGRELHTLSGFDLLRSRQALGRSLSAFAGASLMAELAIRTGTEDPHPALYQELAGGWDAIAAAEGEGATEAAAITGAWRVVSLIGLEPQTDACVICGREVATDEPVRFDAEAGGVACTRCRPVGRLIDPASRAELRRMLRALALRDPFARPGLQRGLLRAFLEAQIAQGKPFRSLELFLTAGEDAGESGGAAGAIAAANPGDPSQP